MKIAKNFVLLLVCMFVLASCGGGGGSSSEGGSKENVVAPEPSWSEEDVAYLVKDGQHPTEVWVKGTDFEMRLVCSGSNAGVYNGVVESGGMLNCVTLDFMTEEEERQRLTVVNGSWQHTAGDTPDVVKGLELELDCQDTQGRTVSVKVWNMDLKITQVPNANQCQGYVDSTPSIKMQMGVGTEDIYVKTPGAGATFELTVQQ